MKTFFLAPLIQCTLQLLTFSLLIGSASARANTAEKPEPTLALTSVATADDEVEDLALSIGRSAAWPVSVHGTISVSNGSIIRVVDQGSRLVITGLKLGAAVVRSGTRRLEVNVVPEAAYRRYADLHEALRDRRGLSISAADGKLKVVGRLLRAKDWLAMADALVGAEPGQIIFSATVEPDVEATVRREISSRLAAVGLANVELRFAPEAVATVGVEPRDGRARAEKVLAPFGIRVEANSSVLALEPLVRVKILVAEIKKSFKQKFGIQWPEALSGTLLPNVLLPNQSLDITLNAMESSGWGRVLASPNLLCRSGKEAEFMAGGEIPIRVSSYHSSEVVWKNYGVQLRVKPLADMAGRMSIEIETEVSALDDAHPIDGVPGLLTNRMQTHFDLARTRTIALSGLIKSDLSHSSSGLPTLGNLPVIGSLFSSKEFRDDRSELVIFVTPEVLKPDDGDLEKNP